MSMENQFISEVHESNGTVVRTDYYGDSDSAPLGMEFRTRQRDFEHQKNAILLALENDMNWDGVVVRDENGVPVPNGLLFNRSRIESFTITSVSSKDLGMASFKEFTSGRYSQVGMNLQIEFDDNRKFSLLFTLEAASFFFKRVEEYDKQMQIV